MQEAWASPPAPYKQGKCCTPAISILGKWKQEDEEIKVILCYIGSLRPSQATRRCHRTEQNRTKNKTKQNSRKVILFTLKLSVFSVVFYKKQNRDMPYLTSVPGTEPRTSWALTRTLLIPCEMCVCVGGGVTDLFFKTGLKPATDLRTAFACDRPSWISLCL